MKLGLLIPTLPERAHLYNAMLANIRKQCERDNLWGKVIIISDSTPRSITTGEKRNLLIDRASDLKCTNVWQIDDDDEISEDAIRLVVEACETGVDVIGINGWMTTDGGNRVDWEIRLGHPYEATTKDGKEYYLRFPNHITPMKLEHAKKIRFPAKTLGEDYEWAKQLNDAGYLKTQAVIETPIYHYKWITKK